MLGRGFVPVDYDVLAGIDVDKTHMAVTFLDHEQMVRSIHLPHQAQNLIQYVRKQFTHQRVAFAYEAGPTGFGLHDQLIQAGFPCLVVAASMIPKVAGQRVKTNRLDSRKLAFSLRGGQLKSIHVPSESYRHLRHLVQLRDTYAREIVAFKCRIKALLLYENIPFPETPPTSQWSNRAIEQLRLLSCAEPVGFKLNHLLEGLLFAQKQALTTQREIRRLCRTDDELKQSIKLLMTIPGMGWIVSSHLLARMGDYRKLQHVGQLGAFVGLVASEHSTGDHVQRGSITRIGDSRLRNKLIQSAWAAIRQDPELREFYLRIYNRHPKDRATRKAIVAVARKLTTRIHAVLRSQRPYVIRQIITQEQALTSSGETRRNAEPVS